MKTGAPEKQFFRYVIPAMASQLLLGFFIIVDGFFIGQSIGDIGLAATNVLWPIAALILAVGLGIGTGGSVIMAQALGEGDRDKALAARGNTIVCLAAASALLTLVLVPSYPYLLRALGAVDELFIPSCEYTIIVVYACTLQIFNSGLNPLLRSSGKTISAMMLTILSLILNLILDWLCIVVLRWGMAGAALATIASQGITALLSLVCLMAQKDAPFRAKQFAWNPRLSKNILFIGISPFGLSMSASILIMLNNWQCIRYGGAESVAVYAIVSYVLGAAQPLLAGIGEGVQPLISYCYGAGDFSAQHALRRRALNLLLVLSAFLCIGMFVFRRGIPILFGASAQTVEDSVPAMFFAMLSLPLWGIVRLFSSCYYSTGRIRRGLFLIYADPLAASPLFLFLLPLAFDINGIWAAAPAAQVLLLAVLIRLHFRDLACGIRPD